MPSASRDHIFIGAQGRHPVPSTNEELGMSSNLFKMMFAVVAAVALGFVCYPLGGVIMDLLQWRNAAITQHRPDNGQRDRLQDRRLVSEDNLPQETVTISDDSTDDSSADDWKKGFDDSDVAAADGGSEPESSSFMFADGDPDLVGITEEKDAPVVEGQTDVVPLAPSSGQRGVMATSARKLAHLLEKNKDATPYKSNEFSAQAWSSPTQIYSVVSKRVLNKLGENPKLEDVLAFLSTPENRRDIAIISLCRKAGLSELAEVTSDPMGANIVSSLASDSQWLTDTLYSGPTNSLAKGLKYLSSICANRGADLNDPVTRRIAITTATEFAREGWSEKDMLERFSYYDSSYREGKLNKIFDTLDYWETRIVTGNRECSSWGSPRSLAWQRDNVRLPAEGYLSACTQLVYRLRNVAGDSVFSEDYLAPIRAATNDITALAYREIGGVCGACSHYGAYGALAAGIPAMTMGEPGHCAYAVRVGNEWKMSYSIYWQHSMHKTFWGLHDWEFLVLTQDLYSDKYTTQASNLIADVASFLAARRLTRAAFDCFDAAVQLQPRNWPAWLAFAGFLKQKGSTDKKRWVDLLNRITDTIGDKYHNVAATFEARYIYPQVLPLIPNLSERNKLFAAFFKKCESFGITHWDINPLLDAQFEGCKTNEDRLRFMRTVLSTLISKKDYSGAALAWGMKAASRVDDGNAAATEKFQQDFSRLLTSLMSRMGSGKKDMEATWIGLGEAIFTAGQNGDTSTFQAIGKIALNKCKAKFPKYKFKFRGFPGKIVSANGLITTAVTLDEGGVRQSCLHWGVLQKNGGRIPFKFEGKNGIKVKFDKASDLTGLVALFECPIAKDRPFHLEVSDDDQNWVDTQVNPEIIDKIMRFDLKSANASGRFVRLIREGDKWENSNILGFYVYGKPQK